MYMKRNYHGKRNILWGATKKLSTHTKHLEKSLSTCIIDSQHTGSRSWRPSDSITRWSLRDAIKEMKGEVTESPLTVWCCHTLTMCQFRSQRKFTTDEPSITQLRVGIKWLFSIQIFEETFVMEGQDPNFHQAGISSFPEKCNKCRELDGDYAEK